MQPINQPRACEPQSKSVPVSFEMDTSGLITSLDHRNLGFGQQSLDEKLQQHADSCPGCHQNYGTPERRRSAPNGRMKRERVEDVVSRRFYSQLLKMADIKLRAQPQNRHNFTYFKTSSTSKIDRQFCAATFSTPSQQAPHHQFITTKLSPGKRSSVHQWDQSIISSTSSLPSHQKSTRRGALVRRVTRSIHSCIISQQSPEVSAVTGVTIPPAVYPTSSKLVRRVISISLKTTLLPWYKLSLISSQPAATAIYHHASSLPVTTSAHQRYQASIPENQQFISSSPEESADRQCNQHFTSGASKASVLPHRREHRTEESLQNSRCNS